MVRIYSTLTENRSFLSSGEHVWAGSGSGYRQPRWGCWQRNLPYSKVSTQFCRCLPWSGLLFTSLGGLKSYKPQALQCSSQTSREMFVNSSHAWERAEILDHSKGWLPLERKSAQKCPYLSTRMLRRHFIPEEVPESTFPWPSVN